MSERKAMVRHIFVTAAVWACAMTAARAQVDPGSCERTCKEQVVAEVQACLDAGGSQDECWKGVNERIQACIAASCPPQPPNPPTPTCEDGCAALKAEMYARCAGPDGAVTDPVCLAEIEKAVADCLAACGIAPPPDPPPPEPTCEDKCAALKADMLARCRLDDGTVDPACEARVAEAVGQCLADCQDQPPSPPTCEDGCAALKQEMYARCAGADGAVIDPVCLAEIEKAVTDCLAACGIAPPPAPATCDEKCEALKAQLLARCTRDDGTVDAACAEEAEKTAESCRKSCVEPDPPTDPSITCQDRCSALAADLKTRCIRSDGTVDEACVQDVEKTYAQCLANCDAPPPAQPPTCEEKCRAVAEDALQTCRANGGSEADCRAPYEKALQDCLAQNCPPDAPPSVPDDDACQKEARDVYDLCLKDGKGADECKDRAAEAYRRCAADAVGPGGGKDSDPALPPDPVPCDQDCAAQADAIYKTFVAAGGAEADGRQLSDAILALCLARCSGKAPCEDRCAVAAQVVMAGAVAAGLAGDEGRRLANLVLEKCVADCGPASDGSDRCAALARAAVRECRAKGGTDEECAAKGEEVAASCAASAAGAPVPTCDEQCRAKAEAMVREWAAAGKDPQAIADLKAAFIDDCETLLGGNCVREAKARLTVFRTFRRGDANRDGQVDLSDAVGILQWLFLGGSPPACEDAADANDDGTIDITDPVIELGSLFLGTGNLPEPYLEAGQDPTADDLICAQ